MTKQIVLRAAPCYTDRRRPLLSEQEIHSCRGSKRVAEVAGGTAAECAAICCCCPCGLVNLLVLAVYRVPAGLCRKALRKRRRKLMKKGILPPRKCGCSDVELVQLQHPLPGPLLTAVNSEVESDKDVVELEKEMWDKFYSAGFWRSPSQKGDSTVNF